MLGTKIKKKFGKKFWQKTFWKNKLQKKNIHNQNFDKCHTIFALLVPFDRTGRKTGSNENVCGIWFKIGSVARSHWTQVMWRFEQSRDKRYNHGLRAVGSLLTAWAVSALSVVRKILVRACPYDEAPEHWLPQKVECCASAVVPEISRNLWSYGVNRSISMVLIHRL